MNTPTRNLQVLTARINQIASTLELLNQEATAILDVTPKYSLDEEGKTLFETLHMIKMELDALGCTTVAAAQHLVKSI